MTARPASKPVDFVGASLDDLAALPYEAKRAIGFQLRLVQEGEQPDDFKPFDSVGKGTYEIRVRTDGDAFRAFYVAKFEKAIYVLHVFQKKSQKTSPKDIDIGRARYATMLRDRG